MLPNKKIFFAVILLILAGLAFYSYQKYYPAIRPVLNPPPDDIADLIEKPPDQGTPGMPLKLPTGFSISIFAKNLPGARVMAFDQFGNMLVSRTSEGAITMLEIQNGKVTAQNDLLTDLQKPHGLAFDPKFRTMLYFAEENKISRVPLYSDSGPEKLIDLPSGEGHFTRTLGFGLDNELYVSIGSSCNICNESDERRAKIFTLDKDGNELKEFARGLRNSVFFAWNPLDGKMWATDMGRDWLGDNNPPDEVNIVEEGKNYGWPVCYGRNNHDTDFDKNVYIRNPCQSPFETPSHIDIPAHSAPLGLAFFSGHNWPAEYRGDMLIALHGSWNSSTPVGYKVVRAKLDDKGKFLGFEDFITGWLTSGGEALGRPADILISDNGKIYISDDKAGVIYLVTYN